MKKNETSQHKQLKELVSKALQKWFGVTINEYQSAGHELDVFSINVKGLTLMVEIIWTPSRTNFYRDLTLLQSSDAKVKILIVNPEIFKNKDLAREYTKVRIGETKNNKIVSPMIDGEKILSNRDYLNNEFKSIVYGLINDSQISTEMEIDAIRDSILSGSPLSPILDKILKLKNDLTLDTESILWLKNELYGYELSKEGERTKEVDDEDNIPGDPDCRKIKGKLKVLFRSSDIGMPNYKEIDFPLFFAQPISTIERLVNDFHTDQILMTFPIAGLPERQYKLIKEYGINENKMSLWLDRNDLKTCLDEFRLKLHKRLANSESDL